MVAVLLSAGSSRAQAGVLAIPVDVAHLAAMRQWPVSFAAAVRALVECRETARVAERAPRDERRRMRPQVAGGPGTRLREALIDLPPPACA